MVHDPYATLDRGLSSNISGPLTKLQKAQELEWMWLEEGCENNMRVFSGLWRNDDKLTYKLAEKKNDRRTCSLTIQKTTQCISILRDTRTHTSLDIILRNVIPTSSTEYASSALRVDCQITLEIPRHRMSWESSKELKSLLLSGSPVSFMTLLSYFCHFPGVQLNETLQVLLQESLRSVFPFYVWPFRITVSLYNRECNCQFNEFQEL